MVTLTISYIIYPIEKCVISTVPTFTKFQIFKWDWNLSVCRQKERLESNL